MLLTCSQRDLELCTLLSLVHFVLTDMPSEYSGVFIIYEKLLQFQKAPFLPVGFQLNQVLRQVSEPCFYILCKARGGTQSKGLHH